MVFWVIAKVVVKAHRRALHRQCVCVCVGTDDHHHVLSNCSLGLYLKLRVCLWFKLFCFWFIS